MANISYIYSKSENKKPLPLAGKGYEMRGKNPEEIPVTTSDSKKFFGLLKIFFLACPKLSKIITEILIGIIVSPHRKMPSLLRISAQAITAVEMPCMTDLVAQGSRKFHPKAITLVMPVPPRIDSNVEIMISGAKIFEH